MKILHLCLSNFYIDHYSYQENILPRQNKEDGHKVWIIASTETYLDNKRLGYVTPGSYINEDGIPVFRLAYKKIFPHAIMKKLRVHNGVFKLLEEFRPDVILFHSLCGWELLTVSAYKRRYPHVRFYADSHEDGYNSAKNFISKNFLHGIYYRWVLNRAMPYIDKILCVSLETIEFVKATYGVPDTALEFYPLGGVIYSEALYHQTRALIRNSLDLSDDHVLFVQAGKMGKKKKVIESLHAFQRINSDFMRLILVGRFDDEIQSEALSLVSSSNNISYLGWKKPTEVMSYLCAADVYLQPGSQSAIMQNAICHRCAVILDDVPSHQPYIRGNGWLLNKDMTLDMALESIARNPAQLKHMSTASSAIAQELLDYRMLASRLYR